MRPPEVVGDAIILEVTGAYRAGPLGARASGPGGVSARRVGGPAVRNSGRPPTPFSVRTREPLAERNGVTRPVTTATGCVTGVLCSSLTDRLVRPSPLPCSRCVISRPSPDVWKPLNLSYFWLLYDTAQQPPPRGVLRADHDSHVRRRNHFVLVVVVVNRQPDLLQVVHAPDASGGADLLEGGE